MELLRRGKATVNDLAGALGITDNAVRTHLISLERDLIVRAAGQRSGTRRPEVLYELTPEAEQLFPKAYSTLFSLLLESVAARLPSGEVEEVLREVGKKVASTHPPSLPRASLRERTEAALNLLTELGGLAELREEDEGLLICGYSCPLADAVAHDPRVCTLAEALLSDVIGAPVQERCDREAKPRCTFKVG